MTPKYELKLLKGEHTVLASFSSGTFDGCMEMFENHLKLFPSFLVRVERVEYATTEEKVDDDHLDVLLKAFDGIPLTITGGLHPYVTLT